MNRKLSTAIVSLFCAACALCVITDLIFPYIMHFIKGMIILGAIGLTCMAVIDIKKYCQVFNRKKKETVYNLIFKSGIQSSIVNSLTVYRILITPVLFILLFKGIPAFKWILLSAFITDALDGFLARRWKVTTKLGARIDSLADDFLFIVSLVAVIYLHYEFMYGHIEMIISTISIFLIKMVILWVKHSKIISSMHTYLTKTAAFLQAIFFIHCIFYEPNNTMFNVTAIVTMVAILEEIIIIFSFKELRQNIKGLLFKSQM